MKKNNSTKDVSRIVTTGDSTVGKTITMVPSDSGMEAMTVLYMAQPDLPNDRNPPLVTWWPPADRQEEIVQLLKEIKAILKSWGRKEKNKKK